MSKRWTVKDGVRQKVTAKTRGHLKALLKAEVLRCGICKKAITHPETATIDHIIPLSVGGKNSRDNVQLAHPRCNRKKGDKLNYKPAPPKSPIKAKQLLNSMEVGI